MAKRPQRVSAADGAAWITGASSGIGRAVALELCRRGWTVAVTARRDAELQALVREAEGLPGRIHAHPADVTEREAMGQVAEAIRTRHGGIALAFFNAGIAPYVRAPHLDVDAVRLVYEVNVMGVVHGLAAVLPAMAERGLGQIAVNASVAGYGGLPRAAAYGSTKAAMIHFCEALKFDCDNLGIMLQVVNPGFVETPLTDKNDFPMPFLVKNEEAARRIVDGFARAGFEITFPRRFSYLLKVINLLPYPLYFEVVSRMTGWRGKNN